MKKEFLDHLYYLKNKVEQDIEKLLKLIETARLPDLDNGTDELLAELRTRRSQLSSIDDIIVAYLKSHSK